jgi:hypothetical protein
LPVRAIWLALVVVTLLAATGAQAHAAQLTVTITSGPEGTVSETTAAFAFTANVRTAGFFCSLDGAPATPCSSPRTYRGLAEGRHVFEVTAREGREFARASWEWTVGGRQPPPPPDPPPPPPKQPPPPGDTPPPPAPPPCGQPGKAVVCFDDIVVGAEVHSQYAADGVEFGFAPADSLGNTLVFPLVAADPGAHSGSRLARTPGCNGDFCTSIVHGRLTSVSSFVEVWVGGGAEVTLTAYAASGAKLGSQTKKAGATASTLLRVELGLRLIAYFQLAENAPLGYQRSTVLFDDLAFDLPDPNANPDFAIGWKATSFDGTLGVSKGGSTTTSISLTRFSGSAGPIQLSAKQLPSGVSASFDPPVADTATKTVKLKVSAAGNAASVTGASFKVVGHPSTSSAGAVDRSRSIPLTVLLSNYDVAVKGIEVTQGIQRQLFPYYSSSTLWPSFCKVFPSLPYRDSAAPNAPVSYLTYKSVAGPLGPVMEPSSVPLLTGRKTVARVFAGVRDPIGAKVSDVPAVLYGKKNGQPLPGSPLSPDDGTQKLAWNLADWPTCYDRANPAGVYTFTLPDSWTHGTVTLRGRLTPDEVILGPGGECGSSACLANNEFTLAGVAFEAPPAVTITPVALSYHGVGDQLFSPPAPWKVFDTAIYMTPGAVSWHGASDASYAGWISITDEVSDPDLQEDRDELCSEILDKVEDDWADEHSHGDATLGVFNSTAVCNGVDSQPTIREDGESFGVVAANRPLKSVAHELFHGYGEAHAGDDPACYSEEKDEGTSWPPDNRGQIHGIGLDTRTTPYKPIVPGALLPGDPFGQDQPTEWIDFMSYCPGGKCDLRPEVDRRARRPARGAERARVASGAAPVWTDAPRHRARHGRRRPHPAREAGQRRASGRESIVPPARRPRLDGDGRRRGADDVVRSSRPRPRRPDAAEGRRTRRGRRKRRDRGRWPHRRASRSDARHAPGGRPGAETGSDCRSRARRIRALARDRPGR